MIRLTLSCAAGAFLLLAAGCATAPKDAPAFSASALPQDPDHALIIVYRRMVIPLGIKATIYVNGVEAVEMPNQAFTWIQVKPGDTSIKDDWPFGVGNPAGQVDMDMQAGHRYYIEITYPQTGGNVVALAQNMTSFHTGVEGRGFEPREETVALPVLEVCCRYVPVESDYTPPDPIASDIPATDVGP